MRLAPATKTGLADRFVRGVQRDDRGAIVALCDDSALWSPRLTRDVIADIESGAYRYVAVWTDGMTTIHVAGDENGKYLRTDKETSGRNNLLDLPDF